VPKPSNHQRDPREKFFQRGRTAEVRLAGKGSGFRKGMAAPRADAPKAEA
jgi:hypothetical protein